MKLVLIIVLFFISAVSGLVKGQADEEKYFLLQQRLPGWAMELFKTDAIKSHYRISDHMNPFYLEDDFDGDHQLDIAVWIEDKLSGKAGILMLHSRTKEYYALGAGHELGFSDNFNWIDIWKVYRETKLGPGIEEQKPVFLAASAILVAVSESSSAVIYWTGKQYKWYQLTD